jgi:3'-phosphoadenosine 5'-phosphosulfate (PAPS) 3'-phosphatase
MWICGSFNKNQQRMNKLFEAINPVNVARVAGSGNKAVYMIDQKADYYINLMPGFKYWDMCAAEALILAMMGVVTDANRKPIVYDHKQTNYTIREGIIIAKNKKVYEVCEKRILKGVGSTIPEIH